MKPRLSSLISLALLVSAIAGAGCSYVSPQALSARRFHESREASPNRRDAIVLSREALEAMGFVHEAGSPAGGEIEMVSRVLPGHGAQLLRQRRAYVKSDVGPGGGSVVTVGFWEVSEESGSEQQVNATGRLLRGGSLYDVFWQYLDAAIEKAAAEKPAEGEAVPQAPAASR